MPTAELRALAFSLNRAAHGVSATVTRPEPDSTPIVTSGIWQLPLEDPQPYGTALKKREPRKVFALSRAEVPTLPVGTRIEAPDYTSGPTRIFVVETFDRSVEQDVWRPIVKVVEF